MLVKRRDHSMERIFITTMLFVVATTMLLLLCIPFYQSSRCRLARRRLTFAKDTLVKLKDLQETDLNGKDAKILGIVEEPDSTELALSGPIKPGTRVYCIRLLEDGRKMNIPEDNLQVQERRISTVTDVSSSYKSSSYPEAETPPSLSRSESCRSLTLQELSPEETRAVYLKRDREILARPIAHENNKTKPDSQELPVKMYGDGDFETDIRVLQDGPQPRNHAVVNTDELMVGSVAKLTQGATVNYKTEDGKLQSITLKENEEVEVKRLEDARYDCLFVKLKNSEAELAAAEAGYPLRYKAGNPKPYRCYGVGDIPYTVFPVSRSDLQTILPLGTIVKILKVEADIVTVIDCKKAQELYEQHGLERDFDGANINRHATSTINAKCLKLLRWELNCRVRMADPTKQKEKAEKQRYLHENRGRLPFEDLTKREAEIRKYENCNFTDFHVQRLLDEYYAEKEKQDKGKKRTGGGYGNTKLGKRQFQRLKDWNLIDKDCYQNESDEARAKLTYHNLAMIV